MNDLPQTPVDCQSQTIVPGSYFKSKKKHPCGSDVWEVLRAGADIKLKCNGCSHIITITRAQLKKQFKETTL